YILIYYNRRRNTRSKRNWSSDVCSSDLVTLRLFYDAGRKRSTAILLIGITIVVNILFDIIQINSIAVILNVIAWLCTIILIVETLLPSRHVGESELKWL